MKQLFTLVALLAAGWSAQAQVAMDFFDANNYNALIKADGTHFWDDSEKQMFIPALPGEVTGPGSIFASQLWIGGVDDSGQLHLAGGRYNQAGTDFHPGPVSDLYDASNDSLYNHVWKIDKTELEDWLNSGGTQSPPASVINWPATGRQAPYNESQNLAPFVDVNGDGIYDPANDMDYPLIRGDQAVYFMYNDDQYPNFETGGVSMGVDIKGMAYGFNCENDALKNTMFFHYDITNRSDMNYSDVYLGLWTDFDIGNSFNDFVASDPLRSMFYGYDAYDFDPSTANYVGYDSNVAAQGLRILKGVQLPADNLDNDPGIELGAYPNGFGWGDGIVDNECIGLSSFIYQNNGTGPTSDPNGAMEYYNSMKGYWKSGDQITYGGSGFDTSSTAVPTKFMFPGLSDSLHFGTGGVAMPEWSEYSAGNIPNDRRGLGAMGPFSLAAGETISFDIALVFAQSLEGNEVAIETMIDRSDEVNEMFAADQTPCGKFLQDDLHPLNVNEVKAAQAFALFPNPAKSQVTIISPSDELFDVQITDMNGRRLLSAEQISGSTSIDVSSLASGLYLVKKSDQHHAGVQRLVIN